ncbi:unnamed protein product [Calicophoron daubneyi]|uniref:G-protein coupled receptors family 1 profile domain-containing protein n=1 Tax=Calicophoron daubneyi TaxID=300641 RepID=A0AAV2TRS1_CALDB
MSVELLVGESENSFAHMGGEALCDFWVCSDVLCCTASILHLVGIAMDRYWAVTNAEYIRRRTAKRICLMIGMFWLLSIAISIPARFNWTRLTESTSFDTRSNITRVDHSNKACLINQEYGYTIFSTVGAFYMPMLFMVGIYARIYQVARARIRRANFKKHTDHSIDSNGSTVTNSPTEKSVLCNNACRYCAVCCISFKRNKHTNGVVKNPVHHDLTSKPQDHSAQSPDKAISQTGETETLQVQTETLTSKSRQNHNSSELPHTVSSSKPTLHHLDRTPPKHQDKRTVCKLKADSYLESSPENNGQGMAYENPSRLHMHGNSSIEYTQYVSSSHHFCHFHRNLWNGTSNSAPPSLCAYSRVCNSWSTLFDSEGSCASNSERSDSIGWSSSYSINFRQPVQTRMNSEPGKSLPPAGLYARLKTLIVRKSYSGHNNPMSTKELKQTEILKDKVKRGISTNGGKVKKSSLPKRRLSHTYSDRHRTMTTREPAPTTDSSQTEEEAGNYLEGKSGARCPVHKPHLEEVIEQEEYSKGKSNLEARLKSTVPGVKKLATVTAMMKRERLEIKREHSLQRIYPVPGNLTNRCNVGHAPEFANGLDKYRTSLSRIIMSITHEESLSAGVNLWIPIKRIDTIKV